MLYLSASYDGAHFRFPSAQQFFDRQIYIRPQQRRVAKRYLFDWRAIKYVQLRTDPRCWLYRYGDHQYGDVGTPGWTTVLLMHIYEQRDFYIMNPPPLFMYTRFVTGDIIMFDMVQLLWYRSKKGRYGVFIVLV